LKNINQKILQEIQLSHCKFVNIPEDAVTIIHTLDMLNPAHKKVLTKKINDFFITKNIKYLNTAM
jgi:hypothetical protein